MYFGSCKKGELNFDLHNGIVYKYRHYILRKKHIHAHLYTYIHSIIYCIYMYVCMYTYTVYVYIYWMYCGWGCS